MKISLTLFLILLLQIWESELAPILPKSRQYLQPLPGFIPVYIRPGNTPLEDINLDLAEAFRSYGIKQGRIKGDRSLTHNVLVEKNDDLPAIDLNDVVQTDVVTEFPDGTIVSTNIQKIFPKAQ